MGEFIGKRVIPRHDGVWDNTKTYEPLVIVLNEENGDSYISRRDVPAGTVLTDEHYWTVCSRFSEQMRLLADDVDADVKAMHKDVEDTKSAMSKELTDTKSAMSKELSDTHEAITQELTETRENIAQQLSDSEERVNETVSCVEEHEIELKDMVVQECIPLEGTVMSANLFIDGNGEIKSSFLYASKRFYPLKGGTGTFNVTFNRADIHKQCAELARLEIFFLWESHGYVQNSVISSVVKNTRWNFRPSDLREDMYDEKRCI